MAIQISKTWAAVDGDRIIARADSRQALFDELRNLGDSPDGYEIVALPDMVGGGPF